ncbi:HlyD family type I secretion periplasmic adaptor subunit [Halomonas sp. EGI 63088]|uniref:Membrane fusion protein (MFP) family protein n=1 Tax=Halomonas flagellata TaxID=2920385 RepID=A0ABS9RS04_9GAMM|nr:HlyD family type I secretion periplasmic adaptor subunit [Halomonas flagellata]MCH4562625.1 HlyD family type I secretion periplasmic adaptor subunit [Halomonas flagellata]
MVDQPRHAAGGSATRPPVEDRRYRRLGIALVLLCFGGFGGWALAASLAVAVVAPGKVSVVSSKKTIQHYEGGIVSDIRVEDGDRVDAGDVLLVLDDTQVLSRLKIARSQYLLERANEVRLLAELSDRERLAFPDELRDSDSRRVADFLAVQRGLFVARRQALQGALDALDQQTRRLHEQREGLEAVVEINRQRVASLNEEVEDHRSLLERGLGDNRRVRELEREMLETRGEIAGQRARIAEIQAQVSENAVQKQTRVQEFHQEIGEQLRQAQAGIADAEERITALDDEVRRTLVKAPVAGTVVGLGVRTRGAVIAPGDPVMEIVPSGEGFVVEARIADRDINNVYPGQPAAIRFTAFDQQRTDTVEGELVHVSADSFEDESSGASYYQARIRVDEAEGPAGPEGRRLLAGMPAEVMIRTGERTFASYLAKPLTDMLARTLQGE